MDVNKKDKSIFSHCNHLYNDYLVCLFINTFEGGYNYIHCNKECKKYRDCIMQTKIPPK